MGSENAQIILYLVDTRPLWPKATKTKDLEDEASRALDLLTEDEKAKVLRYYFVADAKMSLLSHLLKHWVVARYADVPWWDTKITRDDKTKPVFVDPATGKQPVPFNVSHQAGLVSLVAVVGYSAGEVNIGTDIVCTSERRTRDHRVVNTEGWDKFVDMHADVFGRSEVRHLKTGLASVGSGDAFVDDRLRAFYTLWCLREAYVKMTGDALLAPWLKDLEFRRFRAPAKADGLEAAGFVKEFEVLFRGASVNDANICIGSFAGDYMVCTAARTPARKEDALGWDLCPFEFLDLQTVLADAEARLG